MIDVLSAYMDICKSSVNLFSSKHTGNRATNFMKTICKSLYLFFYCIDRGELMHIVTLIAHRGMYKFKPETITNSSTRNIWEDH